MSDEIFIDGAQYILTADAGKGAGLTRDYITRLCREGRVPGKQIGRNWYVNNSALKQFLLEHQNALEKQRQELSRLRAEEYRANANGSVVSFKSETSTASPARDVIDSSSGSIGEDFRRLVPREARTNVRAQMMRALAAKSVAAPGLGDAALRYASHAARLQVPIPDLSAGSIIPTSLELAHKITAFITALALAFGTYSMVDAGPARLAMEKIQNATIALSNPDNFTSLGKNLETQFAAVALNPSEAFTGAVSNIARSFNDGIDDLVYSIASSKSSVQRNISLTSDKSHLADTGERGIVNVRIGKFIPKVTTSPGISATSATTSSGAGTSAKERAPLATTIINNPVVERVIETQRILTEGGISEELFKQKLQQLDNKLTSQIASLSASSNAQAAQTYQVIAQTNKIDRLNNATISNPSISGGSISGVSVNATTLSASDLSAGGALLASTTVTNNLTVGGSLALSSISGILSASNASLTNATSTNFFATNASTTNATSTYLYVSGNTTLTNATTTSLFSTTASSTNLFSQTATFGALNINGLASFISGFLSNASSTITSGLFTMSGGASTTNLTVSGTGYFATATTTNLFANTASLGSLTLATALPITSGGTGQTSFGQGWLSSDGTTLSASTSPTVNYITSTSTTATSTFAAGIQSTYLNITGASATSTFANGIQITGGCFRLADGTCAGASLSLSSANTWTALQLFSAGASTTRFSVFDKAYFGGTATTTIDSAGNLAVAGTLGVTGNTTLANSTTTNLFSTTASSTNLFSQTATFGALNINGLASFISGFLSNASSTITSGLFSMNGGASTTNITASGTGWFSTASTTNLYVSGSPSGILATNSSGLISASTTIGLNFGGTGATTASGARANLAAAASGANSDITSLAGLTTALSVLQGGTGQTSFGQGWLSSNGTTLSASTSPTVNYITSTSTTATSTFAAGIQSTYLNITGASATSTFANGLQLAGGTLAITNGGTGLAQLASGVLSASSTLSVAYGGTGAATLTGLLQGNGTGAITAVTGTAGQLPYFNGTNTLLATSSIYLATSGNFGIGTTTPNWTLTSTNSTGPQLSLGDSAGNSWTFRNVGATLYVATSTYSATSTTAVLTFSGTTGAATFGSPATTTLTGGLQSTVLNITGTSASSTFANGIQLTGGCVSVNGTCLGSGSGVSGGTAGMLAAFTDATTLTATSGPTFAYFTATSTTATSTLAAGLQSTYLNITGTSATSTFANGISLSGGTLAITNGGTGLAQLSSGVLSASSTLSVAYGGTGATTLTGILKGNGTSAFTAATAGTDYAAPGTASSWTALQQFQSGASTTLFSAYGPAYFGATATSSFSNAGVLTLATDLAVSEGGTGASTLTGLLQGNGTSAITGISGTVGQFPYYNGTGTLLATSSVYLATSGNFGIGTTSPQAALHVAGAAAIFGSGELGSPSAVTIRGAAAGGSNVAGANMTFDASNGTGLSGSGALIFRTAPADTTTITFDAASSGGENLNCTNPNNCFPSWSHTTTSSTNRILIISTQSRNFGSAESVSSASYGGNALTQLSSVSVSSGGYTWKLEMWYLLNPPTGSNAISVTMDADTLVSAVASTYYNVNQSTPFGTPVTASWAALTTPATDMPTDISSATNDVVVDAFGASTGAITVKTGNNQNERATAGSDGSSIGHSDKAGAASVTMTWVKNNNTISAVSIVASMKPLTGTTVNTMAERLRITNTGTIGIGTSSPSTTLGLVGSQYLTGGLGVGALNTTAGTLNLGGTSGTTTIASGQGFTIGTSQFVLQQGSGKIGIGTTTPNWILTSSNSSGPQLSLGDSTNNSWTLRNAGATLYIATSTYAATSTTAALAFNNSTGAATFGSPATTTFTGGLQSTYLNITGTSATSTFANGISLSGGTLAITNGGTGLAQLASGVLSASSTLSVAYGGTGATTLTGLLQGNGTGAITAVTGTVGQFPYYNGTGTLLATSSVYLATSGNFGIGTTSPFRALSITGAVSTAQQAIAYDTGNSTDILTSSVGDMFVYPSGNDALFNNSNLWVCTGGSGNTNGCPSGTPSGFGNLIVETKFGVASSTPWAAISVGADGAIVTTEKSLTDGATIAIDWTQGNQQLVVLGGNRTITFSNYIPGQTLRFVVCQDGTGSRTLSWPAAVMWAGGTAPTLTTTASKCDVTTFLTTTATGTVRVFGSSVLNF